MSNQLSLTRRPRAHASCLEYRVCTLQRSRKKSRLSLRAYICTHTLSETQRDRSYMCVCIYVCVGERVSGSAVAKNRVGDDGGV